MTFHCLPLRAAALDPVVGEELARVIGLPAVNDLLDGVVLEVDGRREGEANQIEPFGRLRGDCAEQGP